MPSITPENLEPYIAHGVDLKWRDGDQEAIGECPFCGRDDKFSINIKTGQWRCFVCHEGSKDGGGNAYTFIRILHKRSDARTNGQTQWLAQHRKLLFPETLTYWQVAKSIINGHWLVPGYDPHNVIKQLYRYKRIVDKGETVWKLLPTTTLNHWLMGVNLWNNSKQVIYLCEGPWDAMALWEVLRLTRQDGDGLAITAAESSSLLANANVLAVPGCGSVGKAFERWLSIFKDKTVILMFDNDYPKQVDGRTIDPAGYAAAQRAYHLLTDSRNGSKPKEILYLNWGEKGYDPELPEGFDVRDCLSQGADAKERVAQLEKLLKKITPVPKEWTTVSTSTSSGGKPKIQPIDCRSWKDLVNAWRLALKWRRDLEDALAVMLSVALSTDQVGNQLFLMLIGDAGSAKTQLCEGLLVSRYCHHLEHLTGFHSGWKDAEGNDYSLLDRINHKTLVTPEGDVLMSSPKFIEIMSQQRRIFDGTSGASYKNRKTDMLYQGLRTPWIMAGTPVLLNTDQSRLGDRFLRVIIDMPDEDDRLNILKRAFNTEIDSVKVKSNCNPSSIVDNPMLKAWQMTGGYVDYLRDNSSDLLSRIDPSDEVMEQCIALADFTAQMRARPDMSNKMEKHDTVELPTRLTRQYARLACCLPVVTGKDQIDGESMRIVTKVAMDTSRGRTRTIARHLFKQGQVGMEVAALVLHTGHNEDSERDLLKFMERVNMVEKVHNPQNSRVQNWRLTGRFSQLYETVNRYNI
jgi:hypothetical protein